MKLSFLLFVIPFAAAVEIADERGAAPEAEEYLMVDSLGAGNDGPFVLADLEGRNLVQPKYCYGTKNFNCYRNGYPKCCSQTKGNCPPNSIPGCEGNRNQPGNSICTYSPDYSCYKSGWPQCCSSTTFLCPSFQPVCDKLPGSSYCTYAPKYNCYRSGWPACCSSNGGVNCPKTKPGCNVDGADVIDTVTADEENIIVDTASADAEDDSPEDLLDGTDGPIVLADLDRRNRNQPGYCYGRVNYDCYRNGYPKCCSQTKGNCPLNSKPGCEYNEDIIVDTASVNAEDDSPEDLLNDVDGPIVLADLDRRNRNQPGYCYGRVNYDCYRNGYPKCCSQTKGNCPLNSTPGCENNNNNNNNNNRGNNRNVGRSYCTYSADYDCYRRGWPKCCRSNNGADCPSRKPSCDYVDEDETSEQNHFLRG